MDLLYATQLTVKTAKVQLFDTLVHVHARNLVLCDTVVELNTAQFSFHDILTSTFRRSEHTSFTDSEKSDYKAFFNFDYTTQLDSTHSRVDRLYTSSNLRSVEPLSERRNIPLGLFDKMYVSSQVAHMPPPSTWYYTLLIEDLPLFKEQAAAIDGYKVFVYPLPDNLRFTSDIRQKLSSYSLEKLLSMMLPTPYAENEVIYKPAELYVGYYRGYDRGVVCFLDTLFFTPFYDEYEFTLSVGSAVFAVALVVDDTVVIPLRTVYNETVSVKVALSRDYHMVRLILVVREGFTDTGMVFRFNHPRSGVSRKIEVEDLTDVDYTIKCPGFFYSAYDFEKKEMLSIPRTELFSLFEENMLPVSTMVKDPEFAVIDYLPRNYDMRLKQGHITQGDLSYLTDGKACLANPNMCVRLLEIQNTTEFEFLYDAPVKVNTVRLFSDGKDSKGRDVEYSVWFVTDKGETYSFWRLSRMIDWNKSYNVALSFSRKFGPVFKKVHPHSPIEIVFNKVFQVRKVRVFGYLSNHAEYKLSEITVLLTDYPNFSVVDRLGRKVPYENVTEELLEDYYTASAIPTVFHHETVPRDITESSEVIVFAGVFSDPDAVKVDILGYEYTLKNRNSWEDDSVKYLALSVYPSKFNMYKDKDKNTPIQWNFVTVNSDGAPVIGIPDTIQVTVRSINLDGTYNIRIALPWNPTGWRIYRNDTALPTQGLNADNSFTSDPSSWDTQYVIVQLSLSSGQTVSLEARKEAFGGDITGDVATSGYTTVYDYAPTSIVATDTAVPPQGEQPVFVLKEDSSNPTLSTTVNDSYIPLFGCTLYTQDVSNTEEEIIVDVSTVREIYGYWTRFKVIDARSKEEVPFCFVQPTGRSFTQFFDEWEGHLILLKTTVPVEGKRLLFTTGIGVSSSPDDFEYVKTVYLQDTAKVWLPFNQEVRDESKYRWLVEWDSVDIVPGAADEPSSGAYFYSSDSYIHIKLDTTVTVRTVAFWINTQNADFTFLEIPYRSFTVGFTQDGRIQVTRGASTCVSSAPVVGRGWKLVVIALDAHKIYIDGEEDSSCSGVNAFTLYSGNEIILKGGKPYLLDEFMVFDYNLSQEQIQLLYSNPELKDVPKSVKAVWELCDNVTLPDSLVTTLSYSGEMIGKKIIYKYIGANTIFVEDR